MHVIDADAHVEESVQTWQYLDPEFYPRRPIPVTLPPDTSWGRWNAVWLIDRRTFRSIQYAFHAIVSAGLLEDFPKLRWVFLEAGSEWIVPAVRSAERSGHRHVRKHFDDGRIFASCEPDEDLPYLSKQLGEDWLVVGSDLPHADDFHHDRPEQVFRQRGDLPERLLEKILRLNAARLYAL